MTLKAVEELFRKRRAEISSKICKNAKNMLKYEEVLLKNWQHNRRKVR